MEACPRQLFALKALLSTYADCTGLKVNYAKSHIVPINVSQEKLNHLAATFQCQVGVLPFTYLGLPLSIYKPTVQECLPLAHRVERRLISTSIFLGQGGKLQLVNSVLSSLPTFYMCSRKVPIEILEQIDKYRRHCIWAGGDINGRKPPLAAWKLVCKPKSKGGLGIIRLRLQNDVLLMKNLHKFFTKADLPWVKLIWTKYYSNGKVPGDLKKGSFWWRGVLKLLNTYKGITHAHLGSGDTILFWSDLWNGRILKQAYQQLFSFVINENVTIQTVMEQDDLQSLFWLSLSEEAYEQYRELNIFLQSIHLSGENDGWSYI
jgi:hypothetical protein